MTSPALNGFVSNASNFDPLTHTLIKIIHKPTKSLISCRWSTEMVWTFRFRRSVYTQRTSFLVEFSCERHSTSRTRAMKSISVFFVRRNAQLLITVYLRSCLILHQRKQETFRSFFRAAWKEGGEPWRLVLFSRFEAAILYESWMDAWLKSTWTYLSLWPRFISDVSGCKIVLTN